MHDNGDNHPGDYQVTLCNPTTTTTSTTLAGGMTTTTLTGGLVGAEAQTLSGSLLILRDKAGKPAKSAY